MTHKPDEIKKGLECCSQVGRCMHCCPYYISHNVPSCTLHKSRDALALIQQLESDKRQLEGLCNHMNQLRDAAAGRALKMEERVHQLEAERDAAVAFLKGQCWACKFSYCLFSEEPCASCFADRREKWQWRGVQKEE